MSAYFYRSLSEPLMTYDLHKDLMRAASKVFLENNYLEPNFGFVVMPGLDLRIQ